jgi:hypothetical protein
MQMLQKIKVEVLNFFNKEDNYPLVVLIGTVILSIISFVTPMAFISFLLSIVQKIFNTMFTVSLVIICLKYMNNPFHAHSEQKYHHEETIFINSDPDDYSTCVDVNLQIGGFFLTILYDNMNFVYICSISEYNGAKELEYFKCCDYSKKNNFSLKYTDGKLYVENKENDGVPSVVTVKITLI